MNKRQRAKLNMFGTVLHFLEHTEPPKPFSPVITKVIAGFKEKMDAIADLSRALIIPTGGPAAAKKYIRKMMVDRFYVLAGTLHAFACLQKNLELKANADFTHSDLVRKTDRNLSSVCSLLSDAAEENLVELEAYGINAELVKELRQLRDNFENICISPQYDINQRVTKRRLLTRTIKETDTYLRNVLDRLMLVYTLGTDSYHNAYLIRRSIIDPSHTATCIKGTITDAVTGAPIPDVEIIVKNEENQFEGLSAPDGTYKVKVPQPGIYNARYSRKGFEEISTDNVLIILGKRTHNNVVLKKTNPPNV